VRNIPNAGPVIRSPAFTYQRFKSAIIRIESALPTSYRINKIQAGTCRDNDRLTIYGRRMGKAELLLMLPLGERAAFKQIIHLVEIFVEKAIESECCRHLLKYSRSSSLIICLMFLTNLAQAITKMVKTTSLSQFHI
jgi:hypothetical protein